MLVAPIEKHFGADALEGLQFPALVGALCDEASLCSAGLRGTPAAHGRYLCRGPRSRSSLCITFLLCCFLGEEVAGAGFLGGVLGLGCWRGVKNLGAEEPEAKKTRDPMQYVSGGTLSM